MYVSDQIFSMSSFFTLTSKSAPMSTVGFPSAVLAIPEVETLTSCISIHVVMGSLLKVKDDVGHEW